MAERDEHKALVKWFHTQFPDLADDFHHFANERKCTPRQGAELKAMGVKKGVADFFLAIPLNGKAGLWIELKVGKNKPTKAQLDFAERKKYRFYEFAFCWGWDAAKDMILIYLKPLLANRNRVIQIPCT